MTNILLSISSSREDEIVFAIFQLFLFILIVVIIVRFFQMATNLRKTREEIESLHEDIIKILKQQQEEEGE